MSSLGSPNPFFIAGKKAYEVERSLRFNSGDSPELTRTPSGAGNRTTWTLSFWAKISNDDLGSHGFLFSTGSSSSNKVQINLESSNRITFEAKSGGSTQAYIRPSNNLRDVSAWYHFLVHVNTTHASSDNRLIIYINGEDTRSNLANSTYPSQNTEFEWNKAQEHNIGKRTYSNNYFNGYLAEINFIDGSALFADSFTETNPITGQLIPKKYTGSYGTNGFYLNFADNSGTTATTLGKDSSGNDNNFTPNNFSVSAGAGNDSLEDTPTNNFCTLSPLLTDTRSDSSFTQGNLTVTTGSGASTVGTTFAQTTGKWYAEFVCTAKSSTNMMIGVNSVEGFDGERQGNESQNGGVGYGYINNGNNALPDGSNNSYGATWAINDVMSIALDLDNNTVNFYKNNAAQGTISIADGYNYVMTCGHGQGGVTATFDANFGQRAFSYTPPTGFKKLNSANLPDPTIKLPNKHFDTLLYTGTNTSSLYNVTGLEFQPDWVWGKSRNDTIGHILFDAVRGEDRQLEANLSDAEVLRGSPAYRFLSNGFAVSTVGNLNNPVNYVAWNWNAGDTDGKTYTVKVVSDSGNKYRFDDFGTSAVTLDLAEGGTYIFDQSDSSNAGHPLRFSTTSNGTHGGGSEYTTGVTTAGTPGQSGAYTQIVVAASAPTLYYYCSVHSGMGGQANTNSTLGSSNFDGSIQSTVKVNATAGFSIVTYTGTGSTATVGHGLGVAANSIFIKGRVATGGDGNWNVYHSGIGATKYLLLNSDAAADTSSGAFNNTAPTSSVFTVNTFADSNGSGKTFVAYCLSEVAGYSKFGSYTPNQNDDGPFVYLGFRPRFLMIKATGQIYSGVNGNWYIIDTARSTINVTTATLAPNKSTAEDTAWGANGIMDFVSNGFKIRDDGLAFNSTTSSSFVYFAFAEAPFKYARAR